MSARWTGALKSRALAWVRTVVIANWGRKASAFVLALVVFAVTRDQVSRVFYIPLVVESDPERVLLTSLPETVGVEVRGAWGRINQVNLAEFGPAKLDLRQLRPGPLELSASTVSLPAGVTLVSDVLKTDPVDLRFEPAVVREIPILVSVTGVVDPDFVLGTILTRPKRWSVRGPRSVIRGVERMSTESVDISGATESLEQDVSLAETDSRVEWLGTVHGVAPKVRVSIEVLPRQDQRVVELAVYDVLARKLGTTRVEPIEPVRVSIRGNARDLRELPMRDVPVFLDVVPESRAREDGTLGVEIFIRWSPAVPEGLGSRLQIEPAQTRILARIVPLVEVDEHEHGPGGDEPVDDSTSSKSSTN